MSQEAVQRNMERAGILIEEAFRNNQSVEVAIDLSSRQELESQETILDGSAILVIKIGPLPPEKLVERFNEIVRRKTAQQSVSSRRRDLIKDLLAGGNAVIDANG